MVVNVTKTDPNGKDPLIGQRVGASYRITELLGSGGMGTVYLAESAAFGGLKVAVKVLTAKSSDAVARFVREAYTAGKVNDQFSVVGLVDTGVLETGQHYIALQYCDGGSLQALLEERGGKPLPFDDILSFTSPVCAALVHAHAANLVHRDIKPANILFMKDGTVLRARVGDFGIAKLREQAVLLLTAPKSVMGTPGYMSPEQWMDTKEVDSRSDIYSLGCVLYELVTRRLPYSGTTNEVMHQTKHNAPITPPVALRPDTPPMWNSAIMRCLAHRREDRIQTVLELIHILAGAIENGEATMGFFAPSLITTIATAPTANTISQTGGGPARTLWSQAQSRIQQRKSSSNLSRRRSWAMLVAGVAIGTVTTVTTGAVALMTRSAGTEPDASHIARDEHEAAHAAPTPTEPDAPRIVLETHEAARAAPAPRLPDDAAVASTIVSEPAVARTVAHADTAIEVAATIDAGASNATSVPRNTTAPEVATSAARNATTPEITTPAVRNTTTPATATKPLTPTRPRPTTPLPPSEPPPNRTPNDASNPEVWLSVRVKGFADVSIDGDAPGTSPRRKRVRVGVHHVVMMGYADGSEQQQRKEFDVTVPAGKEETIIYKTW